LTTVTEEQSGADEVPNNPAGRVLSFLREFQGHVDLDPTRPVVLVIEDMLGDPRESARMYHHMVRLRIQADSVPKLMEPYATYPGYRTYFKNYGQVLEATYRLCAPAGQRAQDIFASLDGSGWSALEFADDVLGQASTEKTLSIAQQGQYLDDLRGLIDDVLSDDTLSPQDKQRVIGLLRQVEEALVDIRLFGADRVEDAAATIVGIVRTNPTLRHRLANSKSFQRFVGVIGGLLLAFAKDAGHLAIERAFEAEDKPQIVATQQDQSGQRTDQQPTGHPTPR
jgi:hypothetical protein